LGGVAGRGDVVVAECGGDDGCWGLEDELAEGGGAGGRCVAVVGAELFSEGALSLG
jgi:hypothetical protein